MRAERAVVGFMTAANDIWHAHFPRLHRRAQWHIVVDLCNRGRDGASVGELYGLVKQVFLLDDATVKDRISEIASLGLCTLDPPDGRIAARTVVIPTPALLELFDAHLQALAGELRDAASAIDPAMPPPGPVPSVPLSAEQRGVLLQALTVCSDAWLAALERIFEARNLSKARRLEAKRNLISTSHRSLLLMAVTHHYDISGNDAAGGEGAEEGVLADQMAAALLQLTGQNFQTTRDHIAHLMELGLLERRRGRSLRVALSGAAAAELQTALELAAAGLPPLSRNLDLCLSPPDHAAATQRPELHEVGDETLVSRPPEDPWLRELVILEPAPERRRIPLGAEPIIIGRLPPSGLLLNASEISRSHCQVRLAGDVLHVTDLRSTNGTFVDGKQIDGSEVLRPGGMLQVGPYVLTYEKVARPVAGSDGTLRATVTTLRPRRAGSEVPKTSRL